MTPKTLLALIIKAISIYLVINGLMLIPQLLVSIGQIIALGSGGWNAATIIGLVFIYGIAIYLYILIFKYCLVRTDFLIDKFHLDQGLVDEKISINIHRSTILRITIIVIGIVVMIDSIPLLFKQLITYFQTSRRTDLYGTNNLSTGWVIYYFLKFAFGFFLVTSSRLVVNFIELKRKKPTEQTEK